MVSDCGLRAPRPQTRMAKLWRAQVYADAVRARRPEMQVKRLTGARHSSRTEGASVRGK
jgi:hypothetical protein